MDNNFFNPEEPKITESDYSAPATAVAEPEPASKTYGSYQEFTPDAPKKRFRKAPVIAASVAAVLIAGGAMAAVFNPTVKNFVKMTTSSPQEYYQYVEKEYFAEYSSSASGQYAAYLNESFGDINLKQNIDFTLGKAFADELYLDFIGDLKLSAEFDVIKSGSDYDMSVSANIGDDDLGTVSAQFNAETLALYALYSKLSDSTLFVNLEEYLSDYMGESATTIIEGALDEAAYSFDMDSEELGLGSGEFDPAVFEKFKDFDLEKYLSPQQLEDMMNRYYAILIEGFTDVTLDKSVEASANGNSQKFNVTTATLDIRDTKPIIIRLLEELKNEECIIQILKDYGGNDINEYSYRGAIEILIGQVDSKFDDFIEKEFGLTDDDTLTFELKTYIDSTGKIQGREITAGGTVDETTATVVFSSLVTKNGSENYYEAKAKMSETYTDNYLKENSWAENTNRDLFEALGTYTENDGKISGNFDIVIIDENFNYDEDTQEYVSSEDKLAFVLDVQNYGTEEHDGKLYGVGDITFTIPSYTIDKLNANNYSEIPGEIKFAMNCSYDNGPIYGFNLNIAGSQYLDLKLATKYGAAQPSSIDKDPVLIPEEWILTANQDWILKLGEIFGKYFGNSIEDDYYGSDYQNDDYYEDSDPFGNIIGEFDGTYPMDIKPVFFDGSVYESETHGITLNLPDNWTESGYDQTLTVENSATGDYLMINNNEDFPYSSGEEVENEFSYSDSINTSSTDYYMINDEECIRVDIVDNEYSLSLQSIIYIPSKNLTVFAYGQDWETINAIIQSIK